MIVTSMRIREQLGMRFNEGFERRDSREEKKYQANAALF